VQIITWFPQGGAKVQFVSITRLRLRSLRFLPAFILHTRLSLRQARRAPGCRDVQVRKTRGLAFWTLSVWDSEDAMKTFRRSGAHARAMPKLAHWCDEAAVTHWAHDAALLPSWDDGVARLRSGGRLSKVRNPSEAHKAGRIECT
jgi:quinol monooxygenase YgiN